MYFNVLEEIPLVKFVVQFRFPLAIVVPGPIVNNLGEFCPVYGVVFGHNGGRRELCSTKDCGSVALDRAHNLSRKVIWHDTRTVRNGFPSISLTAYSVQTCSIAE